MAEKTYVKTYLEGSDISKIFNGLKDKQINFRNVGGLVTTLTLGIPILPPLLIARWLALDQEEADPRDYTLGTLLSSFEIGAGIGYALGERIDAFFGDVTPRIASDREIRRMQRYYSDLRNFKLPDEP